jgi:hypothetical protein
MNKLVNFITAVSLFFLLGIALVSCSGGGSGMMGSPDDTNSGNSGIDGGNTGTLSLWLTDGPPPRETYEAIHVTIKEIRVNHEDKGWETLSGPDLNLPQTFNLLELVNGIIADLGAVELEAGHYNQMRLMLGTDPVGEQHDYPNYLIVKGDDEQIPLKVPSGYQTGIKLVKGFDIEHKGSTELLLDFNALKSIVKAGKSGKYILKPTIKVIESRTFSVEGYVDDEDNAETPLIGANVSAQVYDPEAEDPKEEVAEAASAQSIEPNGYYFMYLPITQRDLNIVATMDGYMPECQELDSGEEVEGIKAYDRDFSLNPAYETGTFTGSVSGLADVDGSATFSIRKWDDTCDSMIEVASRSTINTTEGPADYFDPIILPGGTYVVVVSEQVEEGVESEEVTQVWTIEVTDGAETKLDVSFPTTSVAGSIVEEGTDLEPLEGAMIGAYDAGDDLISAISEKVSDADGYYFMYLPTNQSSFNILATMDGFEPQCKILNPLPDTYPGTAGNTIDFILLPVSATGTITGSVSGLTSAVSAHFRILQDLSPCGKLEVFSFDVNEGESSEPVILPFGTYEVVVTATDEEPLEKSVILDEGDSDVVVEFPPTP